MHARHALTLLLIPLLVGHAAPAATPIKICAGWLTARPEGTDIDRQPATGRWLAASGTLPRQDEAPKGLPRKIVAEVRELIYGVRPALVATDRDERLTEAYRRLGRVQSDLLSVRADSIALNQAIVGRENIRRHLDAVDERARAAWSAEGGVGAEGRVGLAPRRLVTDAARGLLYAGAASLLYVVGLEAGESHRWFSTAMAILTGVVAQGRAQAFVVSAYLNLKNGLTTGTRAPLSLSRLESAYVEHAGRMRELLDQPNPRALAFVGFDVPLPLSLNAAKSHQKRVRPDAAAILHAERRAAWPADPRAFHFDQILYFDEERNEPVLLTFIRETSYPQDPTFPQ